jgi:hypothetical protein
MRAVRLPLKPGQREDGAERQRREPLRGDPGPHDRHAREARVVIDRRPLAQRQTGDGVVRGGGAGEAVRSPLKRRRRPVYEGAPTA